MVSYHTYKNASIRCAQCGWTGTGAELETGELFSDLFELDCPSCLERVTTVAYPTVAEGRAHWDKLSADEKRDVEDREQRHEAFENLKLRNPSQLMDIEEAQFTLEWDMVDDGAKKETVIRYNDSIIFREPCFYEGYRRFEEVATVLKQCYGAAIKDLMPMPDSLLYLYGDSLSAPEEVDTIRRRLFGGGERKPE